MKHSLFSLFACLPGFASAGTILVDLDVGTPGIQTSLSVPSGTTITAQLVYDPSFGGPGPLVFTGFGVDLNWSLSGTAATTTPPALVAGDYAGLVAAPVDNHPAGGTPVAPGTSLLNLGLPPGVPGAMSIGGGAIEDFPTGPPFMPTGPVNLAGAMFTVTGAPGDSVGFIGSGIFATPTLMFLGGAAPAPGGAAFQVTPGAVLLPDFGGSTLTIIPEPSSSLLIAMSGMALLRCRRR